MLYLSCLMYNMNFEVHRTYRYKWQVYGVYGHHLICMVLFDNSNSNHTFNQSVIEVRLCAIRVFCVQEILYKPYKFHSHVSKRYDHA